MPRLGMCFGRHATGLMLFPIFCRAQLETSYQRNMPAAVGPVAPRGPAANGALAPMFGGPGGAPGPLGPMGFYPGAMGPQPPRGPGGEPSDLHLSALTAGLI